MVNIKEPEAIESKSMKIIDQEIGELNCTVSEKKVVKRVIHATADPEYVKLIEISSEAVEAGIKAIKSGANIVTDVSMLMAGINKRKLGIFGGVVNCFIADDDVASKAKELEITRSMVAMRKATKNNNNRIFAIGNAPTALFELIKLIHDDKVKVDLIIGTPVGFVGASEAKEELTTLDIPYITVKGRKGGSSVAASIVNAILYMIEE